jgi:hypothetical protein
MVKCVFIAYLQGYKGWRFYNPANKVVISERPDFDECYTSCFRGTLSHS